MEARDVESLKEQIALIQSASGAKLKVELFGRTIPSPVGLAAGPAPNSKWLEFFLGLGYDLVTHKTVRDRYWKGHPMPNLVNVRGGFNEGFRESEPYTGTITNSLGMPSPAPADWMKDVAVTLASTKGRYLVVSVTATLQRGSTEQEMLLQFSSLSRMVKDSGADAVEINLSCPNVSAEEGGEVFGDAKLSGRVFGAVKDAVGSSYPVFVKVGFLPDYSGLVEEVGDDRTAYVVINSIAAPVVGAGGSSLFQDRGGRAGIAGSALLGHTKAAVKSLSSIKDRKDLDYEVIGVGGVTDAATALELLDEGASVVESATASLWDPYLALNIKKALLEREAAR